MNPAIRKLIARRWAKIQIESVYSKKRRQRYRNNALKQIKAHRGEYMEVYDLLEEGSKQIYIDLILFKLTGDFTYILPHAKDRTAQYFSEKIKWPEHPNVIDCGGFIGDTLLGFIGHGIIPGDYYIYEAESKNYEKLLSNIKK